MSSNRQPSGCDRWERRPQTDSLDGTDGVVDRYAKTVELPPGTDGTAVFRRLEERLLTYRIFPPELMQAHICSEDGRLREGTTIVQHVAIGPLTLEAGVRVVRDWHRQDADIEEAGFTYATLEGHPERGVSTFRIRRRMDERTIGFLIDVRSQPDSVLTRLTRPIARRFQIRATQAALTYFTSGATPE